MWTCFFDDKANLRIKVDSAALRMVAEAPLLVSLTKIIWNYVKYVITSAELLCVPTREDLRGKFESTLCNRNLLACLSDVMTTYLILER